MAQIGFMAFVRDTAYIESKSTYTYADALSHVHMHAYEHLINDK